MATRGSRSRSFSSFVLSYNELSPTMKRYFSYCSIFPKDSVIDVEKLIRMWMALGYLGLKESMSNLELKGKEYFNNLRMRSFFQKYIDEDDKRVLRCKMHDIVHDFAQFIRKTKRHDQDDSVEARPKGSSLVSQLEEYRSLFCREELPCELFDFARRVRVLGLWECNLQVISLGGGMEKLVHLRLPEGIERLVNLRYLESCFFPFQIPQGIEKLTSLRTLKEFYAGRHCSKLGYLKGLDQLSGSMTLNINVHDRQDIDEAWKAKLMNKIHIMSLRIVFFYTMGNTKEEELLRNEVLEALQPPSNLKTLMIFGYKGTSFPRWISSCQSNMS
ncbi:UNVERIFIED_CONTAM: putative disease resistance protein RGA3 [Sesamum latifolium]|uniref:Disease resistance protein RGA3 n=1 Tax=Sesamum latifolium TaxID=2727402 RepID=A0AAW2XWA1_9LAMI